MSAAIATTLRTTRRRAAAAQPALITRLPRIAVGLLVACSIVVASLSLAAHPAAPTPADWTSIRVEPHTTLWELAKQHPVDGLDTLATVELIRDHNALASSTLQVGQALTVPSQTSPEMALALR